MVARIKIGPNVVAADFPVHRLFNRDHPLRRDNLSVQPHGHEGLANMALSDLAQPSCQGGLPARLLDRFTEFVDGHKADYNTDSVMAVNTRCVIGTGQTVPMPKSGKISEFWRRLEAARTTCVPAKSMRQEDLAKDYGMSYQSAVTKWKTGGEAGDTKPRPEVVEAMARDCGVSFEWLWWGRGEMRARPELDPLTLEIIDATERLKPAGKLEVLKAAITQETLQLPAVAARLQSAEKLMETHKQSKTGRQQHARQGVSGTSSGRTR